MKQTIAVTVMCVAMMLMGVHVRADDTQNRCTRIGQKWVQFNNSKGISTALLDVFTEDIVYEDVPTGAVLDGAEAFQAFAQGFFDAFLTPALSWGGVPVRVSRGFSNGPGSPMTAAWRITAWSHQGSAGQASNSRYEV